MACALPRHLFSPAGRGLLVILLFLGGALGARTAEEAPAPRPAEVTPPPPSAPVLSLWDCRRIALDKQPTLAAYRASLAFAQARTAAAEDIMVPTLVRPDLPVRRQQASLGVQVAEAQLAQGEADTIYAVTRTYLSAVYARQQYEVAEEALTQLERFKNLDPVTKTWHAEKADVYSALARGRQQEALAGYLRAVAGLREAMGVGPDFCFHLADQKLASLGTPVCREQIIDLAVSRRGEAVQTSLTARIACLEVEAQGLVHHLTAPTFAANSDIHAAPVPPSIRDGIYRPGGLAIEMPTTLAGSKEDRVAQARALQGRAEEVVAKTRNLIALEADGAYQRWAEGFRQLPQFANAWKNGNTLGNRLEGDVRANATDATVEDLFNVRLLARQSQLEYNTALFNFLLALADLERITAGGFCAGFEAAFSPQGLPVAGTPAAPAAPEQPAAVDMGNRP
jgi:hypothetical protein